MKIVISSGHGKHVRGASGYIDEVDEARKVVEQVATVMRYGGHEVTTYHDDVSQSQNENLNRIVDFHNSKTRDLDVSVHFNAYQTTSKPMGCEVLYVSSVGEEHAVVVVDAICAASGLINRGAKLRSDLFFLNNTEAVSILIETCFVDSKADVDIYHAKFEAICEAIAHSITGDEGMFEPKPERPPISGVDPDEPTTLKKGDQGPAVIELQKALDVVIADGDFGGVTEVWVQAFQGACGLSRDGVVGPITADEIEALRRRRANGKPRLPSNLVQQIYEMAQESEIADYAWPDRGVPPPGYIAGMALSYAYAHLTDDDATAVMSQPEGSSDKDALSWYRPEFKAAGLSHKTGPERLRHLFVMMIGLGPRESSGRYFEGRDMSATNVEATTCEAGLFQTSWNITGGSKVIAPLLDDFWTNPRGFVEIFKEGLAPTSTNLNSYGSGAGATYQFLSRHAPLFHVLVTAVGMRVLRQHWGPINRREILIKPEAEDLLRQVHELVEGIA